MKPATVISAPVNRGIAVAEYENAAAFTRSQPCSIFTTIISTAMIPSSTRSPSAMISEPSDTRSRFQPIIEHHERDGAEHDRHGQPDDDAGAPAEAEQADREHDRERLEQRSLELPQRLADGGRLIGDALELDAVRHLRLDLR